MDKISAKDMECYSLINMRVTTWARHHDDQEIRADYNYGSPSSYYGKALSAKVISREEFDLAKRVKGNLWTYRGD